MTLDINRYDLSLKGWTPPVVHWVHKTEKNEDAYFSSTSCDYGIKIEEIQERENLVSRNDGLQAKNEKKDG